MNNSKTIKENSSTEFHLSSEQEFFISKVIEGNNILVDACIGSGKTTAIQHLCNRLPKDKRILYLTYNKLLKLDAKSKIKNPNVTVTNYHGFAFNVLKEMEISVGISDLIQRFNHEKPSLGHYDLLVLDEYQDIEQELAELLEHVKASNPQMQIVAVGDMEQKIYDKTTLCVPEFIEQFLGDHIKLEFTQCFRLSAVLAERLGRIWKKKIVGVNENCVVEEMDIQQVTEFLSEQELQDVLCLGARTRDLSETLNILEEKYPDKYNKKTVFASIDDKEATGATKPNRESAIFTTFDSSKGLERKICVVFDYTESYWESRINKPQQSYEILRNIFCVAASRGKERIIFVNSGEEMLSEKTLSTEVESNAIFKDVDISSMFDFKYKENIEECFSLLKITPLSSEDDSVIGIKNNDELIDLSPCIGIYQEAVFFNQYNIDKEIELYFELNPDRKYLCTDKVKKSTLEEKILLRVSWETNQNRYRTQVDTPFVKEEDKEKIVERLGSLFQYDETVQVPCRIDFLDEKGEQNLFSAIGIADVVKDDVVYELKFVSELTHEHFLQCACYVVALGLEKGILWNTRNNSLYEIVIPDKARFKDAVIRAVTKNYYKTRSRVGISNFAVIDTETNWNDEIMSIGVVVADVKTFKPVAVAYYVIDPEYKSGGMFSGALWLEKEPRTRVCSREKAISNILISFEKYNVSSIFAYNASFDHRHLPELYGFIWHDIMGLAAYRQYNSKIPENAECYKTGKLKSNYGVEPILRMLTGDKDYHETHNAFLDAVDELKIMKLLGHGLEQYECAIVKSKTENKHKPSNSIRTKTKSEHEPDKSIIIKTKNEQEPDKVINTYKEIDKVVNDADEFCSVSEIAERLGVSKSKVYDMLKNEDIPSTKKNGRYIILRNDVDYYIETKQREIQYLAGASLVIIVLIVCFIIYFLFSG